MCATSQLQETMQAPVAAAGTDLFSPKVLLCSLFNKGDDYPKGFAFESRYVYDYEMEFMLTSEGSMIIEGSEYDIKPGDIVFRKPGQYVQGIMPYSCYLICFDLLGNTAKEPYTTDICKNHAPFQTCYQNPILDAIPPVCRIPDSQKYLRLFEKAFDEFLNMNEASQLILKAYVLALLHGIYQDITRPCGLLDIPANQYYNVIKRAMDYIAVHYGEKIKLENLAEVANLSIGHFQKIFTKNMKLSPNEYLTNFRLEKAKELLIKSDLKVAEIAQRCGFESSPYFDYVFRRKLNMSPNELKKRLNYM